MAYIDEIKRVIKQAESNKTPTSESPSSGTGIAKIIDQAWQAMNENKKAEQAVVQKQVQMVTEKKNSQRAPATKPVQTVKPLDNRTTAQKVADSQAAYDSYMGSEEKKQNQQAANRKALQETIDRLFAVPGTTMGEMPLSVASPVPVDQKEQELKATANYYKGQQQAEQDRAVMDADLKEYESWSEQDKADLDRYITERDRNQSNLLDAPQFDTYNLNPLVQKYGFGKVRQMAESLQRSRNEQTMAQAQAAAERAAQERPGLGSIASVGANLIGSYTGTVESMKEAANRTGRYQTMDPNNLGGLASEYGGTVRQGVAQRIEGEDGNWLRKIAAIGYEGLMSAADSTARMAAGGFNPGVSAAIAASGSFGNSLRQYSAQGASPEQAAAAALATSGIEYLTEKIPMDELLKVGKNGSAVKDVLKQAFLTEPTTEEISLFGNVLAEAVILGQKSDRSQRIGELIAGGASYEDAQKQVNQELLNEAARTYAVSAISGGLSAGGTAIVNGNQNQPMSIQEAMDSVVASYMPNIPKEQPVQQTEQRRAMQRAFDEVMGVKPEMQEGTTDINKKSGSIATPESVQADSFTSKTTGGTAPIATAPSLVGDAEAYRYTSETKAKSDTVLNDSITELGTEVKDDGNDTPSQFERDVRKSKLYTNTFKNATGKGISEIGTAAEAVDPNIGYYEQVSEEESLHNAAQRTQTREDIDAEFTDLLGKNGWSGEDNDTAFRVLHYLRVTGDRERLKSLAQKQKAEATTAGQLSQSFAKYSRKDATAAAVDAVLAMEDYDPSEVPEQYYKKQGFDEWKKTVQDSILTIANEIENVPEGDWDSMHDIVSHLANYRHTTAWFGISDDLSKRTERGLEKMDFDTLKSIAKTQLSMIPQDFRKRSAGEVIKAMRFQNMLFTLTTKLKNDTGNIANGFLDAVSDSFGGRMIDVLLSKATGQRTVANDLRYTDEYLKAAKDAADVAAAFVSLDIPMESDTKYSTGKTRTFAASTLNPLGRMLSAFEKHLKYALEVSDHFYAGGASHAVGESLRDLGSKSNLTEEQIDDLAHKVGERRTFKDPGAKVADRKTGKLTKNGRALAKTNVGIQRALNTLGFNGFGLGDLIQPFSAVSGEVAHVGLDYSGAGLATGLKQIIGVLKDARNGIPIDPYRQRSAATNFARGMTGVGLIASFAGLAAAGAIKVHNSRDYEERMAEQAQGLSGAQWNLDASLRWWAIITGGGNLQEAQKAAKWQPGDELIGVDFLEPFNTQMHIGYLLSQGEDAVTAVAQGTFESLLGMPMMQTFSDLADLTQSFTEVSDGNLDGVYDAFGQLVGNIAGSAVPNLMRQTAQTLDPVVRDTFSTDPLVKAGKQIVSAIPFASTRLPAKLDSLGNEQLRFDVTDPVEWLKHGVDTLVTPWGSQEYRPTAAYQEINRLNEVEGINVTIPAVPRRVTYTDNQGNVHDKMLLTDEQYQLFAKTQGQTISMLLNEIMESSDYKALADHQKAYTIKALDEYAQEQAKKAALPNYHSKADAWMSKVKLNPAEGLIRRGAEISLDEAITRTWEALNNDWKVTTDKQAAMDDAYNSYNRMSEEAQQAIFASDTIDGNTKKYIEAREQNVSTDQYIDVASGIAGLVPDKGYNEVRPAQKYEAIAETPGLTPAVTDILMKAYMPDNDNTEKKYDYIRSEMGYSSEKYAQAYDIFTYEKAVGGKGTADRTRSRMAKDLGISKSEAKTLYSLFSGDFKPWE